MRRKLNSEGIEAWLQLCFFLCELCGLVVSRVNKPEGEVNEADKDVVKG